ncbi:glutamate receptor 2-like [Palaemon carinicauda]|uniref:glutamate receptor 2-like n=1 Tax=Palaemon carinicauda TaxID=392227 RepID=UPI0035B5EC98
MGKLLEIFMTYMNFEYELIRPEGGLWGNKLPNGSWTGMMGLIDREEVEMALGPFTITHEREEAADFSMEVQSDNQKIFLVRPGLENDIGGFLKPFTFRVWLLVLASLICMSSFMTFMIWSEDKVFGPSTTNIASKAILWVIQTVSQESSEWLPRRDGGRLLVSTWLLATLVFMSSYSGILTAMLTVPRVTIPIDSLRDLVSQSKLPWRLESGSMMRPFLMNSEDEYRRKSYYGMSGSIPDCWSMREAIANGEFAAICDETTMKKAISWDFSTTGQCHLYIAREIVFSNTMMALAFKRNSSLLPVANKLISTVKETGILSKWLGEEITNTTLCLRPPTSDRQEGIAALNIGVFLGPLSVLVGGKLNMELPMEWLTDITNLDPNVN